MPLPLKTPGVYINEVTAFTRTIAGVATSITAFLGRTAFGPVAIATSITSFSDFTRLFGGLKAGLPLSYAVNDFYLNGGGQAIIVRLAPGAVASTTTTRPFGVTFSAINPGAWGNTLSSPVPDPAPGQAAPAPTGLSLRIDPGTTATTFNVTVAFNEIIEVYRNALLDGPATANRIDTLLASQSQLVCATLPATSSSAMTAGWLTFAGGLDGAPLISTDIIGNSSEHTGIYQFDQVGLFNSLCIPPDTFDTDIDPTVWAAAADYCLQRRAMLIVDPPIAWSAALQAGTLSSISLAHFGIAATSAQNAAVYLPRIVGPDPLQANATLTRAPGGGIAGIWAQIDTLHGVWKSPSGTNAALRGVTGLETALSEAQNGVLNPLGINCLRTLPTYGTVVWGARTMAGADTLSDEYKYIPVRRLELFIENSISEGIKWAVFEANAEPLWAELRLAIGTFLQALFTQGAFQGSTPAQAYFVKCDSETTTQTDINNGVVNIDVGFAPLKPAEFVVIQIQQIVAPPAR
jgi:phage tail sheath protein FI